MNTTNTAITVWLRGWPIGMVILHRLIFRTWADKAFNRRLIPIRAVFNTERGLIVNAVFNFFLWPLIVVSGIYDVWADRQPEDSEE